MIQDRSKDIPRAKSLLQSAVDIYADIPLHAKSRFRLLNYYTVILEILQSIHAADGKKIVGKDHHKLVIDAMVGRLNTKEVTLLQNLRFIRNDIQYYGTKSSEEIEAFDTFHESEIRLVIEKLFEICKTTIQKSSE